MLSSFKEGFYAIYPSFAFQSNSPTDNKSLHLDTFRRLCGGLRRIQKCNEAYYRYRRAFLGLQYHFEYFSSPSGFTIGRWGRTCTDAGITFVKRANFSWPFVVIIILAAAGMSIVSETRLAIDMDITKSLPLNDPVISDSQYVMMHHPVKDRIVVDLSNDKGDVDTLVEGALFIEDKLVASGLFKSVGMKEYPEPSPRVVSHIITHTACAFFTEQELEEKIKPLIETEKIRKRLAENYSQLLNLEGIGQARIITEDPLGFGTSFSREWLPLRLLLMWQISQGHLISSDGRHLLINRGARGSATDTALARKIVSLTRSANSGLRKKFRARGIVSSSLWSAHTRGGARHEETAKKDTRMALIFRPSGSPYCCLPVFHGLHWDFGAIALGFGSYSCHFRCIRYSRKKISILAIGFGPRSFPHRRLRDSLSAFP